MTSFSIKLYSINELKIIRDNFFQELIDASQGKKNSLAFIKNPLSSKPPIPKNQPFQAMVIGGTTFDCATMQADNIVQQRDVPPGRLYNGLIFKTAFDLFTFIETYLDPQVNFLALNFAYPLQPVLRDGLLDGRLLQGTKEYTFDNLIGKLVGQELENYIWQKQRRKIRVTVANDTVCLVLSGLAKSNWPTIVGGIVGTGLNFGFFLDQKTIVNLESANFDKFAQSETGKIVDKNSGKPKDHLFEKETSGAYLYQHFNLHQPQRQITSTRQLSMLAKEVPSLDGRPKMVKLAQQLLERSASLVACQIAGIYLFKCRERSKTGPYSFIMEGSLFWNAWEYKKMVEKYLVELGIAKEKVNFIKLKNSGLLGAAKLIEE